MEKNDKYLNEMMDQFNKIMKENFTEEEIEKLTSVVYKIGVMTAIYNTNHSKDFDVIAEELYKIKYQTMPVKMFKEIVIKYYPVLIKEWMVDADTGHLSEKAIEIINQYNKMLNEG